MANECPKCQTNNPEDSKFCKECATPLPGIQDAIHTITLETPIEELTTGSTFAGRYQIIEELGKGGMGRVYKVLDKETKEKIALKLIKPEIASDKKTIERFRNELTTARKIAQRNVCQMYELNKDKESYYITMEFVSGGDLKKLIRRTKHLPVGTAISIAKQICDGLKEAHSLGIVHRDLKPNNIMIDDNGNARIMDFGIARTVKGKGITGSGVMIGTPEYMSPEQAEAKDVDQRSDIYSMGVILYEMVTGRVPFEGETPLSIAMKHKSEIPKDPRELNTQIPEDLSQVILRCMEKYEGKRYQSAGEVSSELENIEKGIPTTDRVIPKIKSTTSKEITVTFSLKKLLIPAFVVVALIVIALIVWQPWSQMDAVFAPKIENSIAVVSFENQTGDKAYDYLQKTIPNLLITSLEQTGDLYVVTWARMRDLLKQMGEEDVELIDSDLSFEVCRKEGIEAIVEGSFSKWRDTFAIDVKILDVETMKLMTSNSSQGEGIESIIKTQINKLSSDIAQWIGISLQKIKDTQSSIADVTTSSIEAYNYFIRGVEEIAKLNYETPLQFLKKAVDLDPTFAMAYYYLARAYRWLGYMEERNKAYEKAMTLSQRATEKERLYIEAGYAHDIERDPEKRYLILKRMAERFPKEKLVHYDLGRYYQSKNDYDEAIKEFNIVLELDPTYPLAFNNLGIVYRRMSDFEKAVEFYNKYASVSPGDPNPFDSMANCYFLLGRLDKAVVKFKEAIGVKPDFIMSYYGVGYISALKEDYLETMKWTEKSISAAPSPSTKGEGLLLLGFYNYWLGRIDESLSNLGVAKALFEEVGNDEMISGTDLLKGWVHYVRGEFDTSKILIKNSWDIQRQINPQNSHYNTASYNFYLGLIELKLGKIDSAKSRLSEMKSLLPGIDSLSLKNRTLYRYDILDSETLLAEGFPERVIAVYKKTSPRTLTSLQYGNIITSINLVSRDILARAYQQNREIDKAIAEYERLISFEPNSKERRLIHPKYYYRLAGLYKEGNKSKAIEHYEKFLSLWQSADPGLPEVDDARKRLAGLKEK